MAPTRCRSPRTCRRVLACNHTIAYTKSRSSATASRSCACRRSVVSRLVCSSGTHPRPEGPRFLVDHGLFDRRNYAQETLGLILITKAMTHLTPDTNIAVGQNHDLAGWKMRQVSAEYIFARGSCLAVRRSGQGNNAENTRTNSFGHGLDDATFAGAIPSLKDHAYLLALALHPFLKLDEFNVQLAQLILVLLVRVPERWAPCSCNSC